MNNHLHCDNCFKIDCKYNLSCKLIDCKYGCNSKFHQCKELDHHNYICPKIRVACTNSYYGCNLILLRSDLNAHLFHCPASVVNCPAEWNRWNLHTKNSFNDNNQFVSLENLDSNLDKELALRDQLMLKDLYKFKKLRHILRDSICRRYPPVPIGSYISGLKTLKKNEDQPNTDKELTGLAKCHSFISNASNATSTLTVSDEDNSDFLNPPGLQNSLIQKLTNCNNNEKKESEINQIDEQSTSSSSSLSSSLSSLIEEKKIPKIKKLKKKLSLRNVDNFNKLIVNLNIEFTANHHKKPKNMFVFRCGSCFRRDEYSNHYENIHSDIMGSLNGWMISFCPNQQYNCPFFIRRLHPIFNNQKTKIIFSQLNKTFGHQINNYNELNIDHKLNLIDLPITVISKIIKYLDGFSLNNLSLTNKFFRYLVSNELESKGLVNLIWQRIEDKKTGTKTWEISGYNWCFSNSIDKIEKWRFYNDNEMLNHIKNCKYFDRIIKKDPIKLPGLGQRIERRN